MAKHCVEGLWAHLALESSPAVGGSPEMSQAAPAIPGDLAAQHPQDELQELAPGAGYEQAVLCRGCWCWGLLSQPWMPPRSS